MAGVDVKGSFRLPSAVIVARRPRYRQQRLTPPQSPETPASAKSLRAPARGRRGRRRGGRSIGRAWRATARRADSKLRVRLLLRDGDGGQESFLGGRGVGGVALEQDFAARPMQFRFECAIAEAIARRQRFVEDRNGAIGSPARASASASAIFKSPSKFRRSCWRKLSTPRRMSLSPSPSAPRSAVAKPSKNAPYARHNGRSCSRARRAVSEPFSAARALSPRINSNIAACKFRIRVRADMRHAREPLVRAVNEGYRAPDVSQRP